MRIAGPPSATGYSLSATSLHVIQRRRLPLRRHASEACHLEHTIAPNQAAYSVGSIVPLQGLGPVLPAGATAPTRRLTRSTPQASTDTRSALISAGFYAGLNAGHSLRPGFEARGFGIPYDGVALELGRWL